MLARSSLIAKGQTISKRKAVATMSHIQKSKSDRFFSGGFPIVTLGKPPDRHWPFQWRGYLYFSGARSNYPPCCGAIKAFFVQFSRHLVPCMEDDSSAPRLALYMHVHLCGSPGPSIVILRKNGGLVD